MKKITLFFIILLSFLTFGAWNNAAWGQSYHNGTWYSLYTNDYSTTTAWTTTENPTVYAPTTGTMQIRWKESHWSAGFDLWVNGTKIARSKVTESHTSDQTAKATVGKDITSVEVKCYCSQKGYFGYYRIPLAQHIRLASETNGTVTKDFGNVEWGTYESYKVNFRSFLTDKNITVTIEGDGSGDFSFSSTTHGVHSLTKSDKNRSFSVGANMCASENGTANTACSEGVLGRASEYDFTVYYFPKKENVGKSYTGNTVYVKITDDKSTAKVILRGNCVRRNQTIVWDNSAATYNTTDNITYDAYVKDVTANAASGLSVTYAPTSGSPAYMNGNALQIETLGSKAIIASAAGNTYYNAAPDVTKNITINKVTPTVTWPVIDDGLVYTPGEKVQDHWTGGSAVDDKGNAVAGTFACTEELQPAKNSTGYTVTFTPTNTNWYNSTSAIIKKDVAKADQYITWNLLDGKNPRDKYYEYATGEAFDAESKAKANDALTGLTVTYTSSNPAFATIVDDNKLNVVKSNEVVTITATCVDPAGNWNDAVSVSKTFKTCGAKPDKWNVSAANLVYGQLLEESELSGEVKLGDVLIEGTLEWVAPTTLPNAGNHSYSVLFTPENEDAYGSVTFEVPVTVDKADPVIKWNIGERLRENTRYGNFVVSTNTEAALNISVSNSTLLSIEGNVLTTGAVTGTTDGWIKVSQPASTNYNAVPEQTLNVTVNPKSVVCLPFTLQTESDYNNVVVAENKSAWCNTNEEGHRDNYIAWFDVRYTQRVGIALGTWEDGLDGISLAKLGTLISGGGFAWSSKSVDLSFTGVPDKISFDVESQKVTSTPPDATWTASATDWYLYESADGVNYTQVGDKFVSGHQVRNRQLKEETRYVRIKYSGNFTGFVKDLQITQKKYLRTDKSSLEFGTEANPLQEPQTLTLSYSSLGSCEIQSGKITATSNNPAFYVDEAEVTENVGIDQMDEYTIRVRCNDVNQEGTLTLTAYDGTTATVSLRSTKPTITTAHTDIFQTGTEHAVVEGEAYRAQQTIDYTGCFSGSTPVFDTLYIYGVTASSASNRLWENDAIKGYKVPALNVTGGNVHTPCFVYAKNGAQYEYVRTFDAAAGSLDIEAAGKKLGFIGYKPVNGAVDAPAIRLSGASEIYLNNAEIASKGSVMVLNGANTIHASGNNTCSSSNAAAIQLGSSASALTIEDSWAGDATPGKLVMKPAAGKPSIDLNGANNVTINGTQLELHNAVKMAIAHMDGETEKTDGSVKINDGTIVGESSLGMPQNTLIDGGTFNDGTIVCYNAKGKTVRPFNSRGEVLARAEKEKAELPDWYGKAHLTEVAGRVYPMLFGGEGLCIFENTIEDHNAQNELNWTENPQPTSDAIVAQDMNVTDSLTVNSMTINEGVTVVVKNGAVLTIGDGDSFREQAGNLHIENGGKVVLTTGELIVNDFILDAALGNTSQSAASGQVMGEQKLNVSGDAYFRLTLDPLSGRNTLGWYDFVLPFEVDVIGGISMEGDDTPLVFDVNYAVMNYTEAKRAQNGKDWNKYRGTMEPGRVYTIGVDDDYDWNTVIFKKKAGAAVTGDRSFTTEYSGLAADDKDNGWNGFGNGTLHHTELNVPDGTYVQIYDHANRCYRPHLAKDYSIAVGASFFMQVDGVETISLLTIDNKNHGFLAPARTDRNVEKFQLALQAEGAANVADQLWVNASEEATGKYVIGRDLLKMGNPTESKVARMWSTRNDTRLCVNEMTLSNGVANCELSLFAPETKEYTLSVEAAPEEATLYLTYNNRVIWNLSYAPYVFDLSKGTTEGYGLRLVAEAPQMHTDIDETGADAQGVKKVMIDNVLYLVTPQGAMYDINGKIIK